MEKLYLSINKKIDTYQYIIKIHKDKCYSQWIKREAIEALDMNMDKDSIKTNRMENIEGLVLAICDLLSDTIKSETMRLNFDLLHIYSEFVIFQNLAYKIALDYINDWHISIMWDITDMHNPEKVCDICEYYDEEDEDDEDEEDEEELDDNISHINGTLIKIIENRITEILETAVSNVQSLSYRMEHLDAEIAFLKKHIEDHEQQLFPSMERPIRNQVSDLSDAKNTAQKIFDNHEKRIKDLENENTMLKSVVLSMLDKSSRVD